MQIEVVDNLKCPFCKDQLTGQLFRCVCKAFYHQACTEEAAACAVCYKKEGFKAPAKEIEKPCETEREPRYCANCKIQFINLDDEENSLLKYEHCEYCHKKLDKLFKYTKTYTPAKSIHAAINKTIKHLKNDNHFREAYAIAKNNSSQAEKLWLVGGKVYRTLMYFMHGLETDFENCDFDFVTTKLTWTPIIPDDYLIKISYSYNEGRKNPYQILHTPNGRKFHSEEFIKPVVDLFTFKSFEYLTKQAPSWWQKFTGANTFNPFTINQYMNQVPLNIQAIAFDPENNAIFGEVGVSAIELKCILINNEETAQQQADREKLTTKQIIWKKQKSLGLL